MPYLIQERKYLVNTSKNGRRRVTLLLLLLVLLVNVVFSPSWVRADVSMLEELNGVRMGYTLRANIGSGECRPDYALPDNSNESLSQGLSVPKKTSLGLFSESIIVLSQCGGYYIVTILPIGIILNSLIVTLLFLLVRKIVNVNHTLRSKT